MFIRVGTVERYNEKKDEILENFGEKILERTKEIVEMLDEEYGKDRDVFNSDGGWVVLIKNYKGFDDYDEHSETESLSESVYEYCNEIDFDPFVEVLYLVNNETGITVFMPKEIFETELNEDD